MSTIEQTLNAGVPVTFPGGQQFHLLEADEPVDITFYESRNRPLETWEGMKGGFWIGFEKGFIQVKILSAIGQTVKIALTGGRGQYNRSQGDVDILNIVKDNSWYYDSLQKNAFIGGDAWTPAAGFHVELWNPAASGFVLVCSHIRVSCEAALYRTWTLRYHNVAFAVSGTQGNKYLGEAVGVGSIRGTDNMIVQGTAFTEFGMSPVKKVVELPFKNPIIIGEGLGLVAQCGDDTNACAAQFQWTEIPA